MTGPLVIAASAHVHPGARLAEDVIIGPGVVVEDGVTVGSGTRLHAGTVLLNGSVVGARCRIGPYAVIGGEPMDRSFGGEPSLAVLGDDVEVREFATVHRATGEGNRTVVGRGTLVMNYVHVSHNSTVGEECVLTNAVQLGGHSEVGDRAVIGASSVLHQFCRVGTMAMYGAASASNQDILPYSMARGNPARHFRLNAVGLRRNGVQGDRYRLLERALRSVRRKDMAELEELAAVSSEAAVLREFVATSKRGTARFVTAG